jgi:hypothetical protein
LNFRSGPGGGRFGLGKREADCQAHAPSEVSDNGHCASAGTLRFIRRREVIVYMPSPRSLGADAGRVNEVCGQIVKELLSNRGIVAVTRLK